MKNRELEEEVDFLNDFSSSSGSMHSLSGALQKLIKTHVHKEFRITNHGRRENWNVGVFLNNID
jgi:hypothetical protein